MSSSSSSSKPAAAAASTKKGTVGTVLQLKEVLTKELSKIEKFTSDGTELSESFYERVSDILRRLNELPVDLKVLTDTLIGTTVSKFKSCPDKGVADGARALVKKWKKTVKKAGVADAPSKPATTIRRASSATSTSSAAATAAAAAATPAAWDALPTLRRNVRVRMRDALSVDATEDDDVVVAAATGVETAMDERFRDDRRAYAEKFRSLTFNLKKNASLRRRVLAPPDDPDRLAPDDFVRLPPERLATAERNAVREKTTQRLSDSRRLDWEQANEEKINEMCGIKGELLKASLFTCGRCKSIRTTSTQKQTRSADEPMTVFVLCKDCGNRWKC